MLGRRPPRRPFKPFVLGFAVLLITALGGAGALAYREFTTALPAVERLHDYRPPAVTRVLANDGSLLGEFFIEKRYPVPIYRIPRVVQLAFVAAEDASFYQHRGIDPTSIVRAALSNYRAGSTRQGGSTITQQVVKSLLLTPERSYERKLKEVLLALRLEHELTKDEILQLYLNQIYLGNGAYGVQAAAREYFDKDVSELTLGQAALLAGLPQAPSRYSPSRDFDQAKRRQRYVLEQMENAGFIDADAAKQADEETIELKPRDDGFGGPAPHFVEHVRRLLVKRYGASAAYQLGLDVYTTLDPRLQQLADHALRSGVTTLDERQGFRGPIRRLPEREWRPLLVSTSADAAGATPLPEIGSVLEVIVLPSSRGGTRNPDGSVNVRWAGGLARVTRGLEWTGSQYDPQPGDQLEARVVEIKGVRSLEIAHSNGTQGAMAVMAPATGDIVAMIGGLDYPASDFNRATQAMRQPGSSFKPLIFAAALDRGFTPSSVINDAPVSYPVAAGQVWSPKNFSNRFYGPTSLREALIHSRNVVTVKLVSAMGLRNLLDYLPRFGLERPFPKNLSIALGSSEVTLLEMVEAYGVFASGGMRAKPRFITKITDRHGNLIEDVPVQRKRAIPAETAYLISNLLQGAVERGTGTRAKLDERPAAGKTGTTNDMRDAWFIGFTPELLAGVWVGYDQERTLGKGEVGGRAAAPIWREFMEGALAGAPIKDFEVPSEIILVNVDQSSGMRVAAGQPTGKLQAYRRGTEPEFPSDLPSDVAQAQAESGGAVPRSRPRYVEVPQFPSSSTSLPSDVAQAQAQAARAAARARGSSGARWVEPPPFPSAPRARMPAQTGSM